MSFNVDDWIKTKITPLFDEIKPIKNDNDITSIGKLWSLKKEVALHLYIPSYYNIIKNNFKEWYYYDPFCGSGLFEFKKPAVIKGQKFPGSPIVALSLKKKFPFHKYFLSDINKAIVKTLNSRIETLYNLKNLTIPANFEKSIQSVENIDARTGYQSCLAVIDPVGYKVIPWNLMRRLFKIKTCDLFIVVMTNDLHRNLSIALNPNNNNDQKLTEFLGNDSWRECATGDNIVAKYRHQIEDYEKYTEIIRVNRIGEIRLYDILLVSRSKGGFNVMKAIAEKLKHVTSEKIKPHAVAGTQVMESMDRWL